MPLVLDFHHEIKTLQRIKRRDPLKLAAMGGGLIAVGFAGYYLLQLELAHSLSQELSTAESEYRALTPKAEAARKREEQLNASVKVSESMVKRVEGRFYWAPVLSVIAEVVPREVQVTRFSGDVNGDQAKHCSITIDGIATGAEPRKTAEDLRKAMGDSFSGKYSHVTSTFKALEESTETAQLDGHALRTVDFSIVIQLQAGADPAPASTPYAGRKPHAENS